MKLFLSGLALGALAAFFPKVALWTCVTIAILTVMGFFAFIGFIAYLHAAEPREERP